jgi:hypothetical protein
MDRMAGITSGANEAIIASGLTKSFGEGETR